MSVCFVFSFCVCVELHKFFIDFGMGEHILLFLNVGILKTSYLYYPGEKYVTTFIVDQSPFSKNLLFFMLVFYIIYFSLMSRIAFPPTSPLSLKAISTGTSSLTQNTTSWEGSFCHVLVHRNPCPFLDLSLH